MIVSVYGVDAAFVVVRLNAGSVDEGRTSGYSEPNSVTVTAMIATAVSVNAHPSRRLTSQSAPTRAAAATTTPAIVHPAPYASCVQIRNVPPASTVSTPTARAISTARSRTGPSVLRV